MSSENRRQQPQDERSQRDSTEEALKSVLLEDLPIKRLSHKNITIEGYSRAAFQTYWRIPEFRLGFDLGGQPWAFMGTPSWFVSHTHIDHVVALPAYVSRRRMMKMEPPTIYLPEQAVPLVEKLLHVVGRLDRGRLPCQLVPAAPGQEFELSRELVVTTVPTQHTVPSLGFIVWERRKKLKPEFHGLPGEKIRDLRLSGVEVTNEIRLPRVAYLGDTRVDVLDEYPDLYRAEVLIMEVTFLSPHHRGEKIRKFGH
ncbi:MBL fold metallo-hydrolase, partial [Thermogutta sp.]|uniref:MBL fold metallo-hydrolase n=1 Tax=Thermogutta sp. TaxID=1962930 RepID=UPI0025DF4FBB